MADNRIKWQHSSENATTRQPGQPNSTPMTQKTTNNPAGPTRCRPAHQPIADSQMFTKKEKAQLSAKIIQVQ